MVQQLQLVQVGWPWHLCTGAWWELLHIEATTLRTDACVFIRDALGPVLLTFGESPNRTNLPVIFLGHPIGAMQGR